MWLVFPCESGIRRHQATEGETGPKRHIASQLDALGIAGNEETPIHRRAFQNIGNRQAIREERCRWSGHRMAEEAKATL